MPANMCMPLTDPRKRWYKVEPCQAPFRRECARREAYETDLQGAHQMFWLHVYSRTSLLEADSATDLTLNESNARSRQQSLILFSLGLTWNSEQVRLQTQMQSRA